MQRPTSVEEGELGAIRKRLKDHGVDAIALSYVDNAGVARTKSTPLERLPGIVKKGVGMSPVFDAFLFNDSITASRHSGGPMGDLRLFPDLDTLTPVAGMPGWAWAAVDRYDQELNPHPNCSRLFAKRILDQLAGIDVTMQMGFEIEWAVSITGDDSFVPATKSPAYGLSRIIDLSQYSRSVIANLVQSGLVIEQFHPEYAPSQFEISLPPAAPVTAADNAVLARAIIRATGLSFGLRTSFAPVVEVNGVGNGGHVHLSAQRQGTPLLAGGDRPGRVTREGESIVATLLEWLPSLLAIGAPSPASYLRLVPSHWAGAFRCWGIENREAALRLVMQSSLVAAQGANLEIKSFDQAANPYLVVGAVAGAVLEGLREIKTAAPPVEIDPAAKEGAERLPESLTAALAALRSNASLATLLGDPLLTAIIAVREAELEHFQGMTPARIVEETRWVY